jgi:hypothetical protein
LAVELACARVDCFVVAEVFDSVRGIIAPIVQA